MSECYMVELRPTFGDWYDARVFEDKAAADAQAKEWNKGDVSPHARVVPYPFTPEDDSAVFPGMSPDIRRSLISANVDISYIAAKWSAPETWNRGFWVPMVVYDSGHLHDALMLAISYGKDSEGYILGKVLELPNLSDEIIEE